MISPVALTYDDVQIIPRYSEIESRSDVSLNATAIDLRLPIVASPMDTVCGEKMAEEMQKLGGIGCIHRFMSIDDQVSAVAWLSRGNRTDVMAAVGATWDFLERTEAIAQAGAKYILIDVAHGHHKHVKNAIKSIKELNSSLIVIAGSIATGIAAIDLKAWGADILRVGIGGGSLCTTRINTGVGIPNITAIQECNVGLPIIADGGIRSSGDVAKALAAGASLVMLGSMLAGTAETPGKIRQKFDGSLVKSYRGSAALETKQDYGLKGKNVEGVSTEVPFKGAVKYIINQISDGLRSAFSYVGASNLAEFQKRAELVRVTQAGVREASPHLIRGY